MNVYGSTDRGLVRRDNQDYYEVWKANGGVWAVVCDGMGGARSGNVASCMATQTFVQAVKHRENEEPPAARAMLDALEQANEAVLRRSQEDPDCAGMGTTLVAACVQSDWHTTVLNVGDSRAYLIRPAAIEQITRDHSLVADLVYQGKITPEEARNHPNKNIITRAIGTEKHTPGDIFELDMVPGERLLLCTDGLSNVVTDQEMLYEVVFGGSEESCCQRLTEIALKRGAPDNVTVALITVGSGDLDLND